MPQENLLLTVLPPFWPKTPPIGLAFLHEFLAENNLEADILDFNNIAEIIENIALVESGLKSKYNRMLWEEKFHSLVWAETEKKIQKEAQRAKKRYNIYIHNFRGFFKNSYNRGEKAYEE